MCTDHLTQLQRGLCWLAGAVLRLMGDPGMVLLGMCAALKEKSNVSQDLFNVFQQAFPIGGVEPPPSIYSGCTNIF